MAEKKKVVVVGGGIAGSLVALSLQSSAQVVLVDPKEYLEITWATLRSTVEPSFAERALINHADYLNNCEIVTSAAMGLTEKEVTTEDQRRIPYDYLVIATGHRDSSPRSRSDRLRAYEEDRKRIDSSKSVLIVGGGPTGVELAAEIAVDFPEKKVTLVHKGSRLLEFISPKASKKALDWLVSKKVEVVLNDRVDLNSESDVGVFTTSEGETIRAESHFMCAGNAVASSWMEGSFLSGSLDEKGRLKTGGDLRVKGHANIFAVGDITDIPEMKQGYLAEKHAAVAAKNVKSLLEATGEEGKTKKKMATYSAASSAIAIVSLGRREGLAQFPFASLIGCLPGKIKSKDLFVGKTRKLRGLTSA